MVNPVPGYGITTKYKQRGRYWSTDQAGDPLRLFRRGNNGRRGWGIHTGSDISGPGVAGKTIVSATPGKVIAANAYDSSYGYKVIIRWSGLDIWYCHQPRNAAKVKVGQTVKAGQAIGVVGSTGNITGPHLHLEVRIAGGGFALANFRDPKIAIKYKPADTKRIGKWLEINHGAATEALDTKAAMDKWEARRKRVVIIARDKNPDVLGGIECGGGDPWHYISTKYKSFGQVLVINAGGRALWRNSETTEATIDKDIFKPKAYKGDVKEVPWFVGPVNGAMMLTGLAHLDSDAPAAFNADRADEILDFLEAKAVQHKIGRSQIVLMIDMADKTGAVRKRIVDRGYGSVFTVAKKTTNADLSSNTYFKKPVKGYSGDDIFVWVGDGKTSKGPDAPRPIPVASKTVPAKIGDLDHLPLAAVLERQ